MWLVGKHEHYSDKSLLNLLFCGSFACKNINYNKEYENPDFGRQFVIQFTSKGVGIYDQTRTT